MQSIAETQKKAFEEQQERNRQVLASSHYMRSEVVSEVLPLHLDINAAELTDEQAAMLNALSIEAARTAITSVAELAKLNEVDHMGGGLDLIPPLLMTLSLIDRETSTYTFEHAHTSIGYYSCLAALGYIDAQVVIKEFRQGLDIGGHVSFLPGGTELMGGRLGVMVPVAVGTALGKRAVHGEKAWVVCHTGDAGWISGQALNGFNAADLHHAPITFIMHRNGVQLSGATKDIMNKDPRPIIRAMGIEIIEIPSLHNSKSLFQAYKKAAELAREGRPNLIYPTGMPSTLNDFSRQFGITEQTQSFAEKNGVAMDREIWIPGALMSFRDVPSMLENIFLVNGLPGGKGHHDGNMKGRSLPDTLDNPMLVIPDAGRKALEKLQSQPKEHVVTTARPAPGSPNLVLSEAAVNAVQMAPLGKPISPRMGTEAGYVAVAKEFPDSVFVVSCDLDASTRLEKARTFLKQHHQFELSIEEQAATLVADGLALANRRPQLNVISTFAAFFEGIAREGLEMWRYQRNLTGANEGINVVMHLSHVGACTGRDHFSGWSLNWINLALDMLPYLQRFYAPADARSAFIAVKDMAAHYGAHIIGVPRDNLPVLSKQNGSEPLWNAQDAWQDVTEARHYDGARRAILAFGAPAFVAIDAAEQLAGEGLPVDVQIVNGLPMSEESIASLIERYPEGLVTIEDGIIGEPKTGIRGFAGLIASHACDRVPLQHLGIVDPRIAPSEGHMELWAHFGLTKEALIQALRSF